MRPRSNRNGSSNTAASRLAEQYQSTTLSPSLNVWSPMRAPSCGDGAAEVDHRGGPAHDLLDRGRRQRVEVGHPAVPLLGVLGEGEEAVGDGVAGGLVAGDHEEDEERRQLGRA